MSGGPLDLPPGYRLLALDDVDSTNDEARRLAAAGAASGTLVWARRQSRGRGRRGRPFVSPPGNLYCSLLLRPECRPAEAPELCFVAAVAVGETLAELLPADVRLGHKWPNDVLVGGRKVAGILLESGAAGEALGWLVVGVGINLASHPEGLEFPATSLAAHGVRAEAGAVLERYLRCFDHWLERWRTEGFAPVRAAWLARAEGLGRPLLVRLPEESFEGTFAELDARGALILATADGARRRVTAGDVFPAGGGAEQRIR